MMRILFASIHSYVDPSSGAAIATRALLELLAARGHDCRVLGMGVLDYEQDTPLEDVLGTVGAPFRRAGAVLSRGGTLDVFDLELHGVRVTLRPTRSSRADRAPRLEEAQPWLDLADQVLARFRPHVLLTYGGHPASRELMRRARKHGCPVVFHLHNLAYDDPAAFADAAVVLVPTEYARRHYARRLGLECTAIELPLQRHRVLPADHDPRYVTFVNPQPAKGVTVFARIAAELSRRRPEIPLLVVEGRATVDWLSRLRLDLSGVRNLNRMANTSDPREFYRVARAVLVPSLCRENAALVAREALLNGIPVLASDRGGLPETLGDAGFVFAVPERCTPASDEVPTAREVAPWIAAIERLWDDPAFEQAHRERALAEARRWDDAVLADRYTAFFRRLADS
jgi:glycosyltransferase involved in cell wall biosynthesis